MVVVWAEMAIGCGFMLYIVVEDMVGGGACTERGGGLDESESESEPSSPTAARLGLTMRTCLQGAPCLVSGHRRG